MVEFNTLFSNLFAGVSIEQLLLKGIIGILIIVLGVFLGKIISIGLKKISQKLDLNRHIRGSFIDLFLVVIKWSVYILFINLGLKQLGIPSLTNFFTNILIIIPAFTGALILLAIGFVVAYYLKEIIKNSEIKDWELISKVFFYFVLIIFGVYAMKTALISFDEETTHLIIVVIIAVISLAIAYVSVKSNQKV